MIIKLDAQAIIRRFQNSTPVDVTKISEALGLRVWESDDLPNGISGKIMRDPVNGGPEKFSIVVRASDPFVRKRFTVAHELAHYVLHRNLIGSELSDDVLYRSGLTTRQEAQANGLAADILMPKHLINQTITFEVNPDKLAKQFQVSTQAMRIRLGLPGQ
jgi:hypothetical protein